MSLGIWQPDSLFGLAGSPMMLHVLGLTSSGVKIFISNNDSGLKYWKKIRFRSEDVK